MNGWVIALAAVLGISALYTLGFALCRAAGRASRAEERQPVDSYEGPDSLRLLEDLEAHMKQYGARVADLYDTTPGGPNS